MEVRSNGLNSPYVSGFFTGEEDLVRYAGGSSLAGEPVDLSEFWPTLLFLGILTTGGRHSRYFVTTILVV